MQENKRTILCCDDDLGILEILKIIIEEHGFKVITMVDGQNIKEEIEKHKPSIIFLDLWMPKINGDILGKELKNDPKYKNIPLVILSAHKDLEEKAKEIGAEYCIRKPFDIAEIEKLLSVI